jgi:hypothetical protein
MRLTITIVEARDINIEGRPVKTYVQFYRRGIHSDDIIKTQPVAGVHPTFLHSFSRFWPCKPSHVALAFEIYNYKLFGSELVGVADLALDDYVFILHKPQLITLPIQRKRSQMNIPLLDSSATLLIQITPQDFGHHGPPYVMTWSVEDPNPEVIMDLADVVQVSSTPNESFFLTGINLLSFTDMV